LVLEFWSSGSGVLEFWSSGVLEKSHRIKEYNKVRAAPSVAPPFLEENMILTDAQLFSEIRRCEYCENKPCKTACPCDCSPADFMMAAAQGRHGLQAGRRPDFGQQSLGRYLRKRLSRLSLRTGLFQRKI
jgi:hypothetical protein